MKLLGKVRCFCYRDRLSLLEIERRTGLTRKTIRNWLKAPEETEPKCRRQNSDSKIAPYAERLLKMLEIDARRSKRERRTALKLFAELQSLGFDGDYTKVPVRTKAKLKAATTEHMQTLEKSPERVKKYFQDSRVKYAA